VHSTAVKKFGTSSAQFGQATAGNGLVIDGNPNGRFTLQCDFTVEGWFYPTVANEAKTLIDIGGIAGLNWQPQAVIVDNGIIKYYASSANNGVDIADRVAFGTFNVNDWNHFAVCNLNGTYLLFLNGVLNTTITGKGYPYVPQSTTGISIGEYIYNSWGNFQYAPFSGYLDDFRITKGVARYTSNFALPTVASPNY
jgi:hypothetical protein